MTIRLGLLGGTFDPIHLGHIDAADAVCRALGLDRVLLVPARTPPHRTTEPRASAYHRFAMTSLAVADRASMSASDLELSREGPSYTSLTLQAMQREGWNPSQIFFITGSDAFNEISTWHDYPRLLDLANFVVVTRPGFPVVKPTSTPPSPTGGTAVFTVEADTPDVSSTEIRRRIGAGEPYDHMVPRLVAGHIHKHRLYVPAPVAAL
jgi:nicotinate-nucleotide adenylyltransferase